MSARVDLEVKKHLDTMHRELLLVVGQASRLSREHVSASMVGTGETPGLRAADDFDDEEILQPRRLSLRVF